MSEHEELYARLDKLHAGINRLRESHDRLLAALKALLQFNEEFCEDINVSKHYPIAEKARAAIATAEESAR
jgi:hypothetical protein